MSFLNELKRRNVLRIAIFYLAGSWLLIQVLETLFPIFRLDETSIQIVIIILAIGFIPALILSWVFELTPEGLKRDKDVDRSAPAATASGNGLDKIIIVILDLALEWLEKYVARDGPESLAGILDGGFYSKLALDPRFDALLRKHGQHPDQREVIPFRFTPPGSKP